MKILRKVKGVEETMMWSLFFQLTTSEELFVDYIITSLSGWKVKEILFWGKIKKILWEKERKVILILSFSAVVYISAPKSHELRGN